MFTGFTTAFALGFGLFFSAIAGGTVAGAPLWLAALGAWLGYCTGAGVVVLGGAPMRNWVLRRFKISLKPDPEKWFWRLWGRLGIWGLGLIAPVTIGPQASAALALALGEHPLKTFASLALGVVPWCIALAFLVAAGIKIAG